MSKCEMPEEREVMMYERCKMLESITDEQIDEMLQAMRPAIRIGQTGHLFREIDITGVNARHESFTWNPRLVGSEFTAGPIDVLEIPSFHSYGAPSLFKPSLSECLASIRRFCTDWSEAEYFAVSLDGGRRCYGGCHQATTFVISEPIFNKVPPGYAGRLSRVFRAAGLDWDSFSESTRKEAVEECRGLFLEKD